VIADWHFHIEISSKCTLRCPRCPRQEVPDGLINTELNLDFFKRHFTPDFIETRLEKITFCGDDGDPIYAHDLIPVIEYIKSIKPVEFVLVTNGSYKSREWWTQLGNVLDSGDTVHFSIDGYNNDSNNLYRVNSNWDSIMQGMQTLRQNSECLITWAAIAFRFNQDHLDLMQAIAKDNGADIFQVTLSTKFGSVYENYGADDPLEPGAEYVSSTQRFERQHVHLTPRARSERVHQINQDLYDSTQQADIIPLCEIGNKGLYINSQGLLYPCCWVANRYNHNSEWHKLAKQFDLNKNLLQNILNDNFWQTEFRQFRWQECKTKCNCKVVNQEYATSW